MSVQTPQPAAKSAPGPAAPELQIGPAETAPRSPAQPPTRVAGTDDATLFETVESWRARLGAAGLACRAVALHGGSAARDLDLPADLSELRHRWHELRGPIAAGAPSAVVRETGRPSGDLLIAAAIQFPDGASGAVGAVLAPPHSDRTVHQLMLALGGLQLMFASQGLQASRRAARLLELIGHAGAQPRARAAAHEWLNRTAAWLRDESAEPRLQFQLDLFEVRAQRPHWWMSADSAWAEKATPAVQAAAEVAAHAVAQQQEVRADSSWAMPVLEGGQVVSVLVATTLGAAAVPLPESAIAVLRASFGLAEPLLRHWRNADRGLFRHAFDSLGQSRRKLVGPGHLAWKFAAACCAVGLVVLLFLPFTDRVSASTVIEGRQRQIVTAPFDGFLREVRVRPGAEVRRGQLLARLDDRELRLELTRDRSEGEQAAGHLRQAMTEHDAPALALALAEVQQAEARLSLVEAKLARTDLVAPADGLVVNGDWVQQIGSPIESGKELFEIASGQGYRVVLQVPDREIARVRPGQTGVLRLTGQPQAMHTFRVSTVTATASVQDGVNGFRVEAEWVGAVPPLSPGMQGVGKIEVGQANLLTIWTRSSIDWVRLKIWAWL